MDSATKKTILVVDDRALNREFLVTLLGYAGYLVPEAADGVEALAVVRATPIDMVISDILMPTMDGVQFAKAMHADPATAHIPIIFYTATYRVREAKEMAESCGVDSVIAKPAEPQTILDEVNRVLGQQVASSPAPADLPPASSAEPVSEKSPLPGSTTLPANLIAEKLSAYLGDLGALRLQLQNALDHGMDLISEKGELRQASESLAHALYMVQGLSMRMSAMVELGLELTLEREPEKLVDLFCRAAQDIMSTRYAVVGLFDSDGQLCQFMTRGMDPASAQVLSDTLKPHDGILGEVFASNKPRRLNGLRNQPAAAWISSPHPPIDNLLVVPVSTAQHTYGWLYVADKVGDDKFSDEDQRFAMTLAAQLALAHENLLLYRDVQQSEVKFRQLAENIREVFFMVDPKTNEVLYASPTYERIWGRSVVSLYADSMSWAEPVHPDDMELVRQMVEQWGTSGKFDTEFRIVPADGAIHWIRARGFPVLNTEGQLYRVVGLAEDITQHKEQQQKIARLSRITTVLSSINSAIVRIRDRNELFEEACKIAVNQGLFGMAWIGLIDVDALEGKVVARHGGGEEGGWESPRLSARADGPDSERPANVAMRERRVVVCNDIRTQFNPVRLRNKLLEQGYLSTAAFPLIVENRVVGVLALFAREAGSFDEEELKLLNELAGDLSFGLQYIEKEEKLNYVAYYDVLTGLPNATLFLDRLTQLIQGAKRNQDTVSMVLLDLEKFSQLNDVLGRHSGDLLLQQMTARLQASLSEPYTLARISSNTFGIAVSSLRQDADTANIIEHRLFETLKQPFMLDQHEVMISARGGLAMFPSDADDAETLLKYAEIALKKAKSTGERYLYFASEMNTAIATRMALENELRIALDEGQFVVYYQPRVDLQSRKIVSAEALIRWQHPQHGIVSPVQFIPLAEETGQIVPIGAWVIDAVCAQQAAWLAQGVKAVPVAVNLSSIQFKKDQVLLTISDSIELHRLKPKYIEFELTESVVMNNPEAAAYSLQMLKNLGVKLSLDDFGTGYSSLAYLKRFPFDFIKIDRAFVTDIITSRNDAALANAIISMAHGLGLRVVAEGVETEGQLNYLLNHGCDEIQGYYFSPPVPAEEFATMLSEGKRLEHSGKTELPESRGNGKFLPAN